MAPSLGPALVYSLPAIQLVCHLAIYDTGLNGNGSLPSIPPPITPNGYVPHPEIGAAYKFYNETVNWDAAVAQCRSEGANLVVPDTILKLEYLLNQTEPAYAVHVGISSVSGTGNWTSATTGAILTGLPWSSGDPSGGYNCVRANREPRGLRNYQCQNTHPFVCEIPIAHA